MTGTKRNTDAAAKVRQHGTTAFTRFSGHRYRVVPAGPTTEYDSDGRPSADHAVRAPTADARRTSRRRKEPRAGTRHRRSRVHRFHPGRPAAGRRPRRARRRRPAPGSAGEPGLRRGHRTPHAARGGHHHPRPAGRRHRRRTRSDLPPGRADRRAGQRDRPVDRRAPERAGHRQRRRGRAARGRAQDRVRVVRRLHLRLPGGSAHHRAGTAGPEVPLRGQQDLRRVLPGHLPQAARGGLHDPGDGQRLRPPAGPRRGGRGRGDLRGGVAARRADHRLRRRRQHPRLRLRRRRGVRVRRRRG